MSQKVTTVFYVALEKRDKKWYFKFDSVLVRIGKNGFASSLNKREGEAKYHPEYFD
jgi:hypothetical protein